MSDNAEKAAVKDGGDEASSGGVSAAVAEKEILTQKEARETSRTPEEKLKDEYKSVMKQNETDATSKGWGEVGSPKDLYEKLSNRSAAASKANDAKTLDFTQSVSPTLEQEMGVRRAESINLGGAENLNIGERRGNRVPRVSDTTGEVPREYGKRPEGSDKNVERDTQEQTRDNQEGVLKNFRDSLERQGLRGEDVERRVAEMKANLDATKQRLDQKEKDGHLKNLETGKSETSAEQMKRVFGAINEVLEGKKGVDGAYGDKERANWASGAAAALANPERFVNQGAHMTCALTSAQKQRIEAGDPASVVEEASSVVNRGGAFTGTDNGVNGSGDRKWVKVDALSIRPDGESGKNFDASFHGDQGKRSLFGHTADALYGQKAADLQAEKKGLPPGTLTYLAANADQYGAANGQTRTGEGLFLNASDGSKQLLGASPNVGVWQVGELNQHLTGKAGGMFADAKLAGNPPKGYEHVKMTLTRGAEDFTAKLTKWQAENGTSAQIGVNAPFLRGGGENGHGLHAMNAKIKDGAVHFDNNWGNKNDIGKVSLDEIDKATNPDRWNARRGATDGDPGPRPDRDTNFGPRTGRNPNETQAEFDKRREDEKKKTDEEEKNKKEADAKKKAEDDQQLQKTKEREARAQTAYEMAVAQWNIKREGPKPERNQFQ